MVRQFPRGPRLNVDLFGTPLSVGLGFPVVMVTLGWFSTRSVGLLAAWAVLVTVSVLVHEGGHVAALRYFGYSPTVGLTAMGGVTATTERRRLSPGRSIAVSLAGPAAGILLGLAIEVTLLGARDGFWLWVRHASWFVNIWWSLFNLLPIMPLDGGHVIREMVQRASRQRGRAIVEAVAVVLGVEALLWWMLQDRPPAIYAIVIVLMFATNLVYVEITERQRDAYRMDIAHEQLVDGELRAGIATLLPFAMSPSSAQVSTEAYTTLGWALLHERRYEELARLDPGRFHVAHRGLLTAATHWYRGDLHRASADVMEALAESSVEPPETYFDRVFLRLGELDRLAALISTLPRDVAQRAGSRLHSNLAHRNAAVRVSA